MLVAACPPREAVCGPRLALTLGDEDAVAGDHEPLTPRMDLSSTSGRPSVDHLLDTVERLRCQLEVLALQHDREIASLSVAAGLGVVTRGASGAAVTVPVPVGSSVGPTCCVQAQPKSPHRAPSDLRAIGSNSDERCPLSAIGSNSSDFLVRRPVPLKQPVADLPFMPMSVGHETEPVACCAVALDDESQGSQEPRAPDMKAGTLSSDGLWQAEGVRRLSVVAMERLETWRDLSRAIGQETEEAMSHTILGKVVKSSLFEPFFSLIILANCATMGLEAQILVTGKPNVAGLLELSEHAFNVLFTLELAARVRIFGWRKYVPSSSENVWNFADASLVVVTSVIFGLFLSLLEFIFPSISKPDGGIIRVLAVLRALRLLRLIRVVQRVEFFREAWMLLRGLGDSGRTLLWTIVVIFFFTYVFAVFGMVLISEDLRVQWDALTGPGTNQEPSDQQVADFIVFQEYFLSLDSVMMTLIQTLTLDSWNGLVRPLIRYVPWCWAYFYTYIAVAVFVLMNLVTAIIVENALQSTKLDEAKELQAKDKNEEAEVAKLTKLFVTMDKDGDGTLSWDEFQDSFADPVTADKWRLLEFRPEDCKELFMLLDTGDGSIDTEEFFEGLRRTKGVAQSKDVFRLQKTLERMDAFVSSMASQASPSSRTSRNYGEREGSSRPKC